MEKINEKTVGPYPVDVIGLGMSPDDLTPAHLRLIEAADLLVGGRRHLSSFKDRVPETHEVTADLKGLVAIIKNRCSRDRIVVLASGDPLYYGIGAYLVRSLGRDQVRIHPNITSVAAAFARLGEPWQDVRVVSLHGRRSEEQLEQALRTADRLAVFTDPTVSPQWLGGFLRRCRVIDVQIGVFERMGSADERVSWHTPESIEAENFDTPNMVVLKKPTHTNRTFPPLHLGMPEAAFDHQGGLITKTEIRAVCLARLCLRPQQVLWDLGAGSGAVSIEASLLDAWRTDLGRGKASGPDCPNPCQSGPVWRSAHGGRTGGPTKRLVAAARSRSRLYRRRRSQFDRNHRRCVPALGEKRRRGRQHRPHGQPA